MTRIRLCLECGNCFTLTPETNERSGLVCPFCGTVGWIIQPGHDEEEEEKGKR